MSDFDLTYTPEDKLNIREILLANNLDIANCTVEELADLYIDLCDNHYDLDKRNSLLKFLINCDEKYKSLYKSENLLKEAATVANLDYENQYNQAIAKEDYKEAREVVYNFGISELDMVVENWKKFCDTNWPTLVGIINDDGLNKNNPYMSFIKLYFQKNGNITPFEDSALPLNTLNNLDVRGDIDPKQIAFTCGDEYRIKLLLNPNLWLVEPKLYQYYIKTYQWFLQTDMNSFVTNVFIRKAFTKSRDNARPNDKVDIDMNVAIRRACMYTSYIKQITDIAEQTGKNWSEFNRNLKAQKLLSELKELSSREEGFDWNSQLVSYNFMVQQIGVLNKYTQEAVRDARGEGTYQKSDTELGRKGEDSTNIDSAGKYKNNKYSNKTVIDNANRLVRLTGKNIRDFANAIVSNNIDLEAIAQGIRDGLF